MVLNFCFICERLDELSLEKHILPAYPTDLLLDLHYLPCLDYVSGLMQFDGVQIEAHEHYQKQSYRNRCYVRTANGIDILTVPVQSGTRHQPIRDLRVDNSQMWAMHHWRTLQAAYGKAPFFEYYAPDFKPIYEKKWTYLFDLNFALLTICLKLLPLSAPLNLTEWYEKKTPLGVTDARSMVNLRNSPESYIFHYPVPYPQNFGRNFVPNLSIIDLLFCQGPAASDVLRAGFRE